MRSSKQKEAVRKAKSRHAWVLGHRLTAAEHKAYLSRFTEKRASKPDWTEDYCRRFALNDVLYVSSPLHRAQDRLNEAFRRLNPIGVALSSLGKYPFYNDDDALLSAGLDALRAVATEIGRVHRDIEALADEIQAEVGSERKVSY